MNNVREHLLCSRKGCSYATNRPYNLVRHERNHDKGRLPVALCQPCPHCTYAASSVHNLMRHISTKHAGMIVDRRQQTLIKQQPKQQTKRGANVESTPVAQAEQKGEQPLVACLNEPSRNSSLWHWSTPQQQEKNFIRRSGLNAECKLLGHSIKMFKLYALVKARGGACNVYEWDDVSAALSLPSGSGHDVHAFYLDKLLEFEKNEQIRLENCCRLHIPTWWDDGDFILGNLDWASVDKQTGHQLGSSLEPSISIQNVIVKEIIDKYYLNHLNNSKPFQRFQVKDSWIRATNLGYRALIYQIHLKTLPRYLIET